MRIHKNEYINIDLKKVQKLLNSGWTIYEGRFEVVAIG